MQPVTPKRLKLFAADKRNVIAEFRDACQQRNDKDNNAARKEISDRIYAEIFTDAERAAMVTLGKHLVTGDQSSHSMTVLAPSNTPYAKDEVYFMGHKLPRSWNNESSAFECDGKLLNEWNAHLALEEKRRKEVEAAIVELSLVMDRAKTRFELAQLWEPIRDLMGDAWCDATAASPVQVQVPQVIAGSLNSLYDRIKPITQVAA